jgi:hypothetical protein
MIHPVAVAGTDRLAGILNEWCLRVVFVTPDAVVRTWREW